MPPTVTCGRKSHKAWTRATCLTGVGHHAARWHRGVPGACTLCKASVASMACSWQACPTHLAIPSSPKLRCLPSRRQKLGASDFPAAEAAAPSQTVLSRGNRTATPAGSPRARYRPWVATVNPSYVRAVVVRLCVVSWPTSPRRGVLQGELASWPVDREARPLSMYPRPAAHHTRHDSSSVASSEAASDQERASSARMSEDGDAGAGPLAAPAHHSLHPRPPQRPQFGRRSLHGKQWLQPVHGGGAEGSGRLGRVSPIMANVRAM